MRYCRHKNFGEVEAYELGWSPFGPPAMTVHFFVVDSICIDTAFQRMQKETLAYLAEHQVHTLVLTHHHEDHSGNAASLKKALEVPVLGHPETVKKMQRPFKIFPYQHYAWGAALPLAMKTVGDSVSSDHIELIPVHAPGHSKDHTVYWEKNKGWLFSGDLFIAEHIKYFRADEKIKDQIESLKKICQLDFDCLLCAHSPQMNDGKTKLRNKLQFLEDIYGRIKGFHTNGLDVNATILKMGLKENIFLKTFTMGNLSMKNMVRCVYASLD